MNKVFVLLIITVLISVSCSIEDSGESSDVPSVLTLEKIQTTGDLTGGIFSAAPVTLKRTHRAYDDDGEHNVLGSLYDNPADDPDKGEHLFIGGFAKDKVPGLDEIRIGFYFSGPGTYSSAADPANDIYITVKTDYGTTLKGGYQSSAGHEVSITITSVTEDWIEGTFTGSMEYFDGSTWNNEITNVNKPLINGSFKVYNM